MIHLRWVAYVVVLETDKMADDEIIYSAVVCDWLRSRMTYGMKVFHETNAFEGILDIDKI